MDAGDSTFATLAFTGSGFFGDFFAMLKLSFPGCFHRFTGLGQVKESNAISHKINKVPNETSRWEPEMGLSGLPGKGKRATRHCSLILKSIRKNIECWWARLRLLPYNLKYYFPCSPGRASYLPSFLRNGFAAWIKSKNRRSL